MPIIEGMDMRDAPRPARVEAGVYEVRIESAILKENKNLSADGSRGHHIEMRYQVFNNEDPELNGKTLIDRFSTKREARWALEDMMKAAGLSPSEAGDVDTDDFTGGELKVQVVIKNDWPEVTRYIPVA